VRLNAATVKSSVQALRILRRASGLAILGERPAGSTAAQ